MHHHALSHRVALALLLLGVVAHVCPAQDVADLRARLSKAYGNIQTYRATVRQTTTKYDGRWTLSQTFEVAFDRSASNLRIDRPDMLLVADGRLLRYQSVMIPGRHLEAPLRGNLTYAALLESAPFLAQHPMPDVTLLLGGDPTDGGRNVTSAGSDSWGRNGIQYETPEGTISLWMDSSTDLLANMTLRRSGVIERGVLVGAVTVTYDITIDKLNDQFDREWFVFDVANSQPVSDWGDLLSSNDQDGTTLEKQTAPDVDLNLLDGRSFRLKDCSESVVVLCFWSSWGGPPVYRALPAVQKFADQMKQDNQSVGVYTINVRESDAEARQVWEVKQLNLPVALDTRGQAARAYRVGPLPQTVIIQNGKVVRVHIGAPSEFDELLATQVRPLLSDTAISRK